jgi:hypothetical protein
MTIKEQRTDLLAIASTLVRAEKLDEVIEAAKGSKDPDEITIVELAVLMRAVKQRVEIIEMNWQLRLQAATNNTSENTNSDELIETEPEAVKASGF